MLEDTLDGLRVIRNTISFRTEVTDVQAVGEIMHGFRRTDDKDTPEEHADKQEMMATLHCVLRGIVSFSVRFEEIRRNNVRSQGATSVAMTMHFGLLTFWYLAAESVTSAVSSVSWTQWKLP